MAATISTPYVIIIEQPTSKPIRYRYKCEGRSAGTIPGEQSTNENKTFPTIKVVGYRGRAKVIVSCVTKEPPYRPHPHSLVGGDGCYNGICTIDIASTTQSITFRNLGVQCVRRKDVQQALYKRQNEVGIDPFNTGFEHYKDPASIDMNVLRLCFQVFIENNNGECTIPLQPVVSEAICDRKAINALIICRLSECVSPVNGNNKDIYLLCKRVAKDNIKVRFFEGDQDNPTWEGFPDIQPAQVHEQTAIWFRAPPYKNLDITTPVKVFIQLLRPSDGGRSEPRPFEYLPMDAEPGMLKRKRQKFANDPKRHILLELQNQLQNEAAAYNIQPALPNFPNLNDVLTRQSSTGNEFISLTVPHVNTAENYSPKILNSMVVNYPTNIEPKLLNQTYRQPESATPGLYSPLYENISSPIYDNIPGITQQPHSNYLNTMQLPLLPNTLNEGFFETSDASNLQTAKEKVRNAIRAKCKLLQSTQPDNISAIMENMPTTINQLELRSTSQFNSINQTKNCAVIQNDLGTSTGVDNYGSSLLDVDFEQLDSLLVPEETQYNCLNIPMHAMTISDASCNLSSLLNMDTSQITSTISSEQLDNLLAII